MRESGGSSSHAHYVASLRVRSRRGLPSASMLRRVLADGYPIAKREIE